MKDADYKKRKDRKTVVSLIRNTPRTVRNYRCKLKNLYSPLLKSFSREDFIMYENLHHTYGSSGRKREVLIKYLDSNGITSGPIRELAEIRNKDLKIHQKLWQMLKHIWMNLDEYEREQTNQSPNRFFKTIATQIIKNGTKHEIYPSWNDTDKFATVIKDLYHKQNGLCAITGQPLELQLGEGNPNLDRLSVDRIDSKKGYIPKNIWLVAWWVNFMKSNLDLETFKEKVEILHRNLKKQPCETQYNQKATKLRKNKV